MVEDSIRLSIRKNRKRKVIILNQQLMICYIYEIKFITQFYSLNNFQKFDFHFGLYKFKNSSS